MRFKNKHMKRLLNIIYFVFVLGCFAYGVGSITYANTSSASGPDVIVTIDKNGAHSSSGDLFDNELWYPGKEKKGVLRIVNNYKKANINDLGIEVILNEFKPEFSKDAVYNSFINNMKLTLEKGSLLSFSNKIVDDKSLAYLLENGLGSSQDTISIGNSIDFKYTLKMAEAATNELESMSADIKLTFNANEVPPGGGGGGGGNGGGGSGGNTNEPTPPETFDGDLIDRMPGFIALNDMQKIEEKQDEIIMPFNVELLRAHKNLTPRIYYWNEEVQKWVALASYVETPYTVRAINDGGYTGWFNVFGVIQPQFTDLADYWAEPVTNRMNGLGIIEGYPGSGWVRPAQLEQNITRTEFTTLIYRLLNINPDKQILEIYEPVEARNILIEYYGDVEEIPEWAVSVVAATTKAELVEAKAGKFIPNEPITKLEAAMMVKKAFEILEKYQPVDYTRFNDVKDMPDWAQVALAKKVIGEYPDNLFGSDNFITRAEALTVLKRLFIIGMGL